MKKFLCLSIVSLILAGCLVGCGDKDDSKKDSSEKTTASDSANKDKNDDDDDDKDDKDKDDKDDDKSDKDDDDKSDKDKDKDDDKSDKDNDKNKDDDKSDKDKDKDKDKNDDKPSKGDDVSDSDINQYVGKWESTKMVFDGQEIDNLFGIPIRAMMQMELTSDGKFVMTSPMDEEESEEGTWEVIGKDKIKLNMEDESVEMTYKNGTLHAVEEEDGESFELYIEKVDKFTEFDFEDWANDFDFGDMGEGFGDFDLG